VEDFSEENLKEILIPKIAELGLKNGQVLWPMRVALTGEQFSPGAFEIASALGKERSLKRLHDYIDKMGYI
jgi:glutamyl/glutaminyl-tRNA synthetase